MQLGVDEVRRLERDLAAANARIAEMEAYQCNQQCNLLASRDARIAELGTTAATVEHYQAMVTGLEAELAALKSMQCGPPNCALCASLNDQLAAITTERNVAVANVSKQGRRVAELESVEERLLNELAALKEAGRWRKASEEPPHGNHVLAINANGEMWIDFWYYHERRWFNESNGNHDDMTMWRELPNPPKEGE
jgi:hypothetical protein